MKIQHWGLISLIVFSLSVHQAWAENWNVYHPSVEGMMSYDQHSIRQTDGNIIQVRTKTILNDQGKKSAFAILQRMKIAPCDAGTISHEITLEQYDCVNRKYKIFSTTIYDTQNKILVSQKAIGNKWNAVRAKSAVAKLMNIVCGTAEKEKAKKQ